MPHLYADRVKEMTASTGPGPLTLAGAAEGGFVSFAAGIGVGNTTDITIRDPVTGEWEVCQTEVLTAATLSRGTLRASSSGGRISFASGTKEVFCCLPAVEAMRRSEIQAALDALDGDIAALGAATAAALAAKAPLEAPSLTGNPTAPTPSTSDNDTTLATTAHVHAVVAARHEPYMVALSDEGAAITTGDGKAYWHLPFAYSPLVEVLAGLGAANSSSGTVTVDVEYWTGSAWASIFSTPLTIDANEDWSGTAATAAVLSVTTFAKGTKMRANIDGAGAGAKGLKLYFMGVQA